MKQNILTEKTLIKYLILITMFILSGFSVLTAHAKTKEVYFAEGNLYYHVLKSSKVEVCGTKKTKGTLIIPSEVTYKGKAYTVIGIADHERVYKDVAMDTDNPDGAEVDVNLPGMYYYGYYRKDKKAIADGVDCIPGSKISKVVFPSTLTYIGEGAFCGCDSLKTVEFAKKYKRLTIGANAFCGKKLKSIAFPEGTVKLGENAAGTTKNISIPSTVTSIGAGVVNVKTDSVKISKKNKKYKMKNGILYTKNEKTLVGASGKVSKTVTISSKTTSIADHAFAQSKVTKVVLSDKVTSIPTGAFTDCSKLTAVEGTDGVTSIGYAAFKGCDKIESIGDMPKLTDVKRAAFWGDNKLALKISSSVLLDENAISGTSVGTIVDITIPENDSVYSFKNGFLIMKKGNEQVVIMQKKYIRPDPSEPQQAILDVPEGVTKLAVVIECPGGMELTLPSTLKAQNSKIRISNGTVTYNSVEVPKLGGGFDIVNVSDGRSKVYVPKESLEAYKTAMDNAVDKRYGIPLFDDTDMVIVGQ